MKVLIAGAWTGWMGLHLRHFAQGFEACNAAVIPADYHEMSRSLGFALPKSWAAEQRNRSLEKLVRQTAPDLILFAASWKFDMMRLRSYFNGPAAVYDYDGPRRATPEQFLHFKASSIAVLTVSRSWQAALAAHNIDARYLPHGVDTGYYAPGNATERELRLFSAPVSYIGRATDRRAEFCRAVSDLGLALYGSRWSSHPGSLPLKHAGCIRLDRDVCDRELVSIYRNSALMINILQEPLHEFQTILSLQCFAIPAAGACLAAEYVQEMEESFETGKEILSFRTPEELRELALRCAKEPGFVRAVGDAGRKRCIACHTHRHRAEAILKQFLPD